MASLSRRSIMIGTLLAPLAARAQSWPSGPIRIIVPFPPGGSVDAVARFAQAGLGQRLGATVLVENRTGASGSTGSAVVAKSPPDGLTWLIVFDTHAVNPSLLPNFPFDNDKDLDPVSLIATAPYVVARHPSRPYTNLGELIRAAKEKPHSISYASVGSGSIGHLALELLSKEAGIDLIHVPYRGGAPALNDTVAGHVDLIIASAALLTPQIVPGAIRPVVQMGKSRLAALPDVPTVGESGYPGAQANSWWAMFAPAGTPKPIIARFRAALVESLREERIAKQLGETQQMTLVLSEPEELRSFASAQARIWGAVVRENNIKADE
ncbi:MAG TPA: tripartite tricarboxylate transporter substrate binding protein [Xanthobacteraceae bacterium]